jgi:hypothetical protein
MATIATAIMISMRVKPPDFAFMVILLPRRKMAASIGICEAAYAVIQRLPERIR